MIALSGYSGASVVSLNSRACTQSLKFEITRSTFSEVGPSMMSQPVSIDSAPRLAAPRRKLRRDDCGNSFAASLIRSFGSTPGGDLRRRDMPFSLYRPTIMARRLFGTIKASAICTVRKPTIEAMAKKCT